jgi:hypothetical protein
MYSKKAKMMVAEQIVGMIENNVLNENGGESFIGWLEDGDVFFNADCYTDEEIDEAMRLAHEITDLVDELSWKIAPEIED